MSKVDVPSVLGRTLVRHKVASVLFASLLLFSAGMVLSGSKWAVEPAAWLITFTIGPVALAFLHELIRLGDRWPKRDEEERVW